MNSQDSAATGLDEGYWAAILSQGEIALGRPTMETSESWNGFSCLSPDEVSEHALERRSGGNGDQDRWALAKEFYETGEVFELDVTGYNRGGLLVSWDGLRGFVPASHLSDFIPSQDEEQRLAELAAHVGTRLQVKIIELDASIGRLILSERLADENARRRDELLSEIEPGDVLEGRVTNLCSFGAFVDLGGVEGLIHISELSWGRVDHPEDVLQVGEAVSVYVLNVHPEEGRVGLSLKRLLPDPWETVEERYSPGQLISGVVTNVVGFGAFTRIEEGLEGLIHVSELAEGSFLHPRNVVQEGDRVVARVLSIDSRRRRMALSLRQVSQEELDEAQAEMDGREMHSERVTVAN